MFGLRYDKMSRLFRRRTIAPTGNTGSDAIIDRLHTAPAPNRVQSTAFVV
jgi:hypothetical protein